jgi:hypothetical protein
MIACPPVIQPSLDGATTAYAAALASALVALAAWLLATVVERRSFFAAVRRGKIAGLVLRPSVPEDAHLPLRSLFFGPRLEETLEQESNTGYRDAPRRPLWRVGRWYPPIVLSFAGAVLATVIIAVLAAVLLGFLLIGLRSAFF